jgi:hypothetical protein
MTLPVSEAAAARSQAHDELLSIFRLTENGLNGTRPALAPVL